MVRSSGFFSFQSRNGSFVVVFACFVLFSTMLGNTRSFTERNPSGFRMTECSRTQLVSAIHLQEVELQEKAADNQQGNGSSNNNGELEEHGSGSSLKGLTFLS